MNLEKAKIEFATRMYWWSQKEIEREVLENFPTLKRVKSSSSLRFLQWMDSMDKGKQLHTMKVLSQRSYRDIISLDGKEIDEDELETMISDYRKNTQKESPYEQLRWQSLLKKENTFKVNKRHFGKILRNTLDQHLGTVDKERGDWDQWYYVKKFGNWDIVTYLDVGGHRDVEYEHKVAIWGKRIILDDSISPLIWLGIGTTMLDILRNDDKELQETAQVILDYSNYFFDVVPKLLSGIELDEK
jgi:hypothetical protein